MKLTGYLKVSLNFCTVIMYFTEEIQFATDGAILTKTKNAVQGSMKIIPCDCN